MGNLIDTAGLATYDQEYIQPIIKDTFTGTCTTAAGTANKDITVQNNFSLRAGVTITVKFTNTNTAENPKFKVNNGDAKSVWYNTALITNGNLGMAGTAGKYSTYVYDGTQWVWVSQGNDSNTTYTPPKLGSGYGTCSTSSGTALTASLTDYTLVTGGIVTVKFTNAVPAGATLNINSKGAKSIYYRGAAITAGVIEAGDIATFVYSSQYHLIAIDKAATANKDTVTKEVAITGWSSDTTSQSGTTLYKKQITLTAVYDECPTIDIGCASGSTLPTVAQQTAYNLLQYVTVDDSVPCLYLYASAQPTTAFYIKVKGVA